MTNLVKTIHRMLLHLPEVFPKQLVISRSRRRREVVWCCEVQTGRSLGQSCNRYDGHIPGKWASDVLTVSIERNWWVSEHPRCDIHEQTKQLPLQPPLCHASKMLHQSHPTRAANMGGWSSSSAPIEIRKRFDAAAWVDCKVCGSSATHCVSWWHCLATAATSAACCAGRVVLLRAFAAAAARGKRRSTEKTGVRWNGL